MKNNKVWNVLVFPGGTENGLEINKSLRYSKEVKLFSVSSGMKNHAEYMYKNHFEISDIYNPKCIVELNKVLEENNIDFIFPANSLVIDFLITNRDRINSKIIQPDNEVVNNIRSKKKTYKLFQNDLIIPNIYESIDDIENYPIFIKPDAMYGSQGIKKIHSKEELESLDVDFNDFVVSEYLPGDEFSIECFSTKGDGLLYTLARSRERIRMGTSMRSEQASSLIQKESKKIAQIIHDKLNIDGLWFFQLKFNSKNQLALLEIESRVAGTMAFSRVSGVNLPLANLYYADNKKVKIHKQAYDIVIDRSLANRYKTNIDYQTVYIDLDDTIVIKNKLNTDIMKFLFQCVNENKKIILISKSIEKDKMVYLKKYKIEKLFDELIWLSEEDSKSNYIKDTDSIFIDDSFSQRLEVEQTIGIHTFEPNMIEVLINDRNE